MSEEAPELQAGRVGRPHGLDGSFYVTRPRPLLLGVGMQVTVDGRAAAIVRRAGTDKRPIVRLEGVHARDAAEALRGLALSSCVLAASLARATASAAEASLLAAGALCYAFGLSNVAVAAIVLAMGLENAVFQIDGGAGLGLTYVTGALVKVGQLAAEALRGGARWGWAPNLLLWAALVAGSLCGAVGYHWINLAAIWFAAASALALSAILAVTIHL